MKLRRRCFRGLILSAVGLLSLVIVPAASGIGEPAPGCHPGVPRVGGPCSYTLAVSGTLAGGALVNTTVRGPRDLGLVVMVDNGSLPPPGLVPLGRVDPGTRPLPWDLRVGGQLLAPGQYVVALEIFGRDGRPSGRPFPPPALLTVSPDGHTSAVMTSLPTKSETDWTVVIIGVIVALAIGALVSVVVGRRRRPAAS